MKISNTYGLSVVDLCIVGVMVVLGLAVMQGVFSTYQSIPTEAAYLLTTSFTLIATAIGYARKKSWTRYTYSLLILLAAVFFLTRFSGGVPTADSGISIGYFAIGILIGVAPLVALITLWKQVTNRIGS